MNNINPLNKQVKLALFTLALTFAVTGAQAADSLGQNNDDLVSAAQEKDGYAKNFEMLDKDHDGTLSRSEAAKDKSFKGFAVADKDHDGTLTEKEYTSQKFQAQKKHAGRVASDSTITAKVKALIIKDEGLKGMQISVKTYQGVVLLSGFVDSQNQIDHAKEVAQGVSGVKSVKNSLVVKKS